MLSDGIPKRQVAESLGISTRTLERRLAEWQESNRDASSSPEEKQQENGQLQGWRPQSPDDYRLFTPQHFTQIAPLRKWEGPLGLQPLRASTCPQLQQALSDWELFYGRVATLADYLREDAPRFASAFAHTPREFAVNAASTIIKRLEPTAVQLKRDLERGISAAIEHEGRLVADKLQEKLRQAQADPTFPIYTELARLWGALGDAKLGYLHDPPPDRRLALALFARLRLAAGLHTKLLSGDRLTLALLTGVLGNEKANQLQQRLRELRALESQLRSLPTAQLFAPLREVASSLPTTR